MRSLAVVLMIIVCFKEVHMMMWSSNKGTAEENCSKCRWYNTNSSLSEVMISLHYESRASTIWVHTVHDSAAVSISDVRTESSSLTVHHKAIPLQHHCPCTITVLQQISGNSKIRISNCGKNIEQEYNTDPIVSLELQSKHNVSFFTCDPTYLIRDVRQDGHANPNTGNMNGNGGKKDDDEALHSNITMVLGILLALSVVLNVVFIIHNTIFNKNKGSSTGPAPTPIEREPPTGQYEEFTDPCQGVGFHGTPRPSSHDSENSLYGVNLNRN